MHKKIIDPQDQVFWYLKTNKNPRQLTENIKTDVVIVGGGIAGLSAAQSFHEKGLSVVLLEKYYCGSGASGKSSGFITPDSELNLQYFTNKFGPDGAKKLWEFVTGGVSFIKNNIQTFELNCDYKVEDTLVVANSKHAFSKIEREHAARKKMSYESSLYNQEELQRVVGSQGYFGGVRYDNTFGVDMYAYCQGMKDALTKRGVQIYEETPAVSLYPNGVKTPGGFVEADSIIVCVDRFLPELQKRLSNEVFHAQTFLMMSAPLSDHDVRTIFPEKSLMVWDTDLIYQYYRVTGDNRFMIGGSDLISIFWGSEQHNNRRIIKKLTSYAQEKFPSVRFNFEYSWPGLIGVSKDIMPLAGSLSAQPNIYYISAAAGLPWAAALGRYSAEKIVERKDDFDDYFSLQRKFPVGGFLQSMVGKRVAFALSNLWTIS